MAKRDVAGTTAPASPSVPATIHGLAFMDQIVAAATAGLAGSLSLPQFGFAKMARVPVRRIGLRSIVVALTLSIVAPLGLASVLSIQRTWQRQLANIERQNVATARAVSVAIDTEIE